jgi:hypothetical protein
MRKHIRIIAIILIISTLSAKEKVEIQEIRNGRVYSQEIYIIENSTTRPSEMSTQSSENITHYLFANGNEFNSKSKIMIKFNSDDVDIKEIESKYNLRLKRKMNSGDYLFENLGEDTLSTINLLLKEKSSKIKRVSPNMILNMKPM